MKKEDLISDLNKEAKKLVNKRIRIIHVVLSCVVFLLSWHWHLFGLSADITLWHVVFISILFLSSIFTPLWKTTKEKVKYTFYEVCEKRWQECANKIYGMAGRPCDVMEWDALHEKKALLSEILSENITQARNDPSPKTPY